MTTELMTQLGYVVASGLFIFGLKMLGSPATARRGNMCLCSRHAGGNRSRLARSRDR